MPNLEIELTKRQTEAWKLLTSLEDVSVLYGGAKGGGKSWFLCWWAFLWTQELIKLFGLEKSEFPLPIGFIGRKRGVDFRTTTLETWKKNIPPDEYQIREMNKEIVIADKAKILFGGLDNQEDVNKFNSAELAFLALDQAEETEQEDISVLEASLRLTHNGKKPAYKKLYTANPRKGWLKTNYVKERIAGKHFVRALPSDNPHLPVDYENTLKESFGHNPALLKAYLFGEWDVFEGMYFEEFDRRFHVYMGVQPSGIGNWPKFLSVDWGYASPMAVYWHAVGPDRHVWTYREWYKTKVLDVDAAREIKEITDKAGEKIEYCVGDPQSFPVDIPHFKAGKTVSMKRYEVWAEQGVPMLMGDSKRIPGWSRMREYLSVRDYMGHPSSWWHIHESCTNLIDELCTAVHDKNKIEDIAPDSVDHGLESCAISSTCILMCDGEKPIEEINVGDLVHTRKGLRRVLVSKPTGEKETVGLSLSDGRFLIASTDHPVLCGNSWKPISQLQSGEEVWITPTATEKRGRYGEQQMAIFRKDSTSTTSTEIPKIMISPTLSLLNEVSTCADMESSSISEVKNGLSILPKSDLWQRLADKILKCWRKSALGTKDSGPQNSPSNESANGVGANTKAEQLSQKCVPLNAVTVISVQKGEKQRVYNLQVDDCPEYFANGVLVHNCRLFLMSRPPLLEVRSERLPTMLEAAEKQHDRDRELEGRRLGC